MLVKRPGVTDGAFCGGWCLSSAIFPSFLLCVSPRYPRGTGVFHRLSEIQ